MNIDLSAAEQFLAYVDGDAPLAEVWDHPAYEIAREHAALFGRELTREDVKRALDGEETAFTHVADLAENRARIARLLETIASNEDAWTRQIERELERVVSDEELSNVTMHLAIGYSPGVGLADGAYVNLNEPLFLRQPRQLLYTAIHEGSHVVYERVHGAAKEVTPDDFRSSEGQRRVFQTVFHTEAYATYAPLERREADGNLGAHDHPTCEDYAVLSDETRMRELVAAYDSIRDDLRHGAVSRERLLSSLFGEPRLPYRVGCALLQGLEEREGLDAVREGFYADSAEFVEAFDWVLDEYRSGS